MSDPNPYVILRSVGSAPLPAAWQEHGPRQQA